MKVVKRAIDIKEIKKPRVFTSKRGWKEVGGKRIYFRSEWEKKFSMYLEFLKKNNQIREWEHEPQTFWFNDIKRGVRSYLPDFKITRTDGTHYWVEVKGYMDAKSKTKIKRFKKYYPKEEIELIQSNWFGKGIPLHF